MDIREALLAERSKRQTTLIVKFIGNDAGKFRELVGIFLAGEYRLTQRAAWSLSCCAENYPLLIAPYLEVLVNQLERQDVSDAVRRNVVRMLQFVEIPEDLAGKVYSICLGLIDNPEEAIAIRALAVTVAGKIARAEPDLIRELQLFVNKHLRQTLPAFRHRAKAISAL